MKIFKRSLCLAMALCLLLGSLPVLAAEQDGITVYVDNRRVFFTAEPRIVEGRTLVAIRPVCESIGADVSWEQETRTAIITRAGKEICLTIDSLTATVNGEAHTLDVAPALIESNTMLPLRFIMEQMGQAVAWDAASRAIHITEDMSFITADNDMLAWILGCGAILARRNSHDPYSIGMLPRRASTAQSARNTLSTSWGCSSREDVVLTIVSMTDGGHSVAFEEAVMMGKLLQEQGLYEDILAQSDQVDAYMWPMVMELDAKWGDKAIKAWDWFRMMHLAGWGYLAGYLELEEAYILCRPVAQRLKATFSSWDEATDNYMDGYAFWARIDLSQENNEYVQRYGYYEALKAAQESDGLLFDPAVWE